MAHRILKLNQALSRLRAKIFSIRPNPDFSDALLSEMGSYTLTPECKPATSFLFELIARLQSVATVPMMDIRAYAKWLDATVIRG